MHSFSHQSFKIPDKYKSRFLESDPDKRKSLHDLKERIRRSRLNVLDGYSAKWETGFSDASPELPAAFGLHVFGQWIFSQLWGVLKSSFMASKRDAADVCFTVLIYT